MARSRPIRRLRRLRIAGGAAAAQDGQDGMRSTLPTLTIEADGQRGFFGETFAQRGGVGDEDRHADPRDAALGQHGHPAADRRTRGARSLTQALQYTPGVFAGYGGNDNRGDWLYVRGFEPTIFLDGMQSLFRLLQQHQAGALPARQRRGAEGAGGDALRQRRRRRHRQRDLEAAGSSAPEHRPARSSGPTTSSRRASTSAATLASDGKLLYRLVGLGRSADGPVDYSNDDAAAFMPSMTWTPTERTSVTVLGFTQKNDTSPIDPVPVALAGC